LPPFQKKKNLLVSWRQVQALSGGKGVNENFYVSCVAGDKQKYAELIVKKNGRGETARAMPRNIYIMRSMGICNELRHRANFVLRKT
jgi:hypothetical protein